MATSIATLTNVLVALRYQGPTGERRSRSVPTVPPGRRSDPAADQKRNSQYDRSVLRHLAGVHDGKSFGTDLNGTAVDLFAVLAVPAYGSAVHFGGFIGARVFDQYPLRIEFGLDLGYAQHFVHRCLYPEAIIEHAAFSGHCCLPLGKGSATITCLFGSFRLLSSYGRPNRQTVRSTYCARSPGSGRHHSSIRRGL